MTPDVVPDPCLAQVRPGEVRVKSGRSGEVTEGQMKSGEVRVKSGEVTEGQVKLGESGEVTLSQM